MITIINSIFERVSCNEGRGNLLAEQVSGENPRVWAIGRKTSGFRPAEAVLRSGLCKGKLMG
jgi:hypothetical protein